MANSEALDPYGEAVTKFESLMNNPFSSDEYRAAITEVQAQGFQLGVKAGGLFQTLEDMSNTARIRAASEQDQPTSEQFLNMQKGYRAALNRLTQPAIPEPAPRSRTGVAAG